MATYLNNNSDGEEKLIEFQLNSKRRAEFARLQGINNSIYSEIDPLHVPEVLALVGRHHGQEELYLALKSSLAGLASTVNKKEFLKQQIAEKRGEITKLAQEIKAAEADIAKIESAEGQLDKGSECSPSKKRRVD